MPRRRVSSWLPSAAVGGIGLAEGVLFGAQGRPLPALLAIGVLGIVAWVLSSAAFPRSNPTACAAGARADGRVVIYWRSGCVYCLRLRWLTGRLARRAVWVDIWANEEAAAVVRAVNDGNETVPTVIVGETVRTNPEVAWVRRALKERRASTPDDPNIRY